MGGNQLGFSGYEQTTTKKQAKSAKFLSKMEMVVPCDALITLTEPHYPKTSRKGERPAHPLVTMLWIHLLQQLYSLNDPAMEEALIEVPTMGRFAGIDLSSDDLSSDRTAPIRKEVRSGCRAQHLMNITPSRRSWASAS